jgi:hypothetical protein
MVIFLPLVLMLFVVSVLSGGTNPLLMLPMLLTLVVGVVYIVIAMRDGTERKSSEDPSIRALPATFLGRQMHSALRTRRPKRHVSPPSWGAMPRRPRSKGEKGP